MKNTNSKIDYHIQALQAGLHFGSIKNNWVTRRCVSEV